MLSTFTWICIFILALLIKRTFIMPMEDKNAYEVYAARDELAMGAIDNKVDQNNIIYEYMIDSFNAIIYYIRNDYDFSILLYNIFKVEPKKMEIMTKRIATERRKNTLMNESAKKVDKYLKKYVIGIREKIFVKFFLGGFELILEVLSKIIDFIIAICDKGHSLGKKINEQLEESSQIRNGYDCISAMHRM